jgi:hypothetical protein
MIFHGFHSVFLQTWSKLNWWYCIPPCHDRHSVFLPTSWQRCERSPHLGHAAAVHRAVHLELVSTGWSPCLRDLEFPKVRRPTQLLAIYDIGHISINIYSNSLCNIYLLLIHNIMLL